MDQMYTNIYNRQPLTLAYEQLLELLVAIVDAELFEAVLAKYLKAVDVEDPNDGGVRDVGVGGGGVDGGVDLGHYPGEQLVVHGLQHAGVSSQPSHRGSVMV